MSVVRAESVRQAVAKPDGQCHGDLTRMIYALRLRWMESLPPARVFVCKSRCLIEDELHVGTTPALGSVFQLQP
jgi:hypothetical protein